jgi:hypothetical protein
MTEKFYRYVPYAKEKEYEKLGWEFESPLPLPHACYASLYVWRGEGDPVEPKTEITVYSVKKEKTDE